MSVNNKLYLAFDVETTGLDRKNDRIVSTSLTSNSTSLFSNRIWYINPGIHISSEASKINKFTDEQMKKGGEDPVVALEEVANIIASSQEENIPLIIYNSPFDLNILKNDLLRNNLKTLEERIQKELLVIDMLLIDRINMPNYQGKRNFYNTLERFDISYAKANFNHSTIDSIATLELTLKYFKTFPKFSKMTNEELMRYQKEGIENIIKKANRSFSDAYNNWPY
jgi:DNA polymerase-3 subunit epsilon